MKVRLARSAGFCMGVRRAMDLVLTEANKGEGALYTYGPLIHNNQVLNLLAAKNIVPVEDLDGIEKGRIVVRAHGIPPGERQTIKASGLKVVDATCPRVARVQALIRGYTRKGYEVVIIGDRNHAEVMGLMGYSENPVHVIQTLQDVRDLPCLKKPFVVAQTTQNIQHFETLVDALGKRFPGILVFDTICDATHQRQEEVRSFKGQVDAVVVVGGYHSANTRRLVEVALEEGMSAFHIEAEKDLDALNLAGMEVIGVTAGASTPNWLIKNIVRRIEGIRGSKENLIRQWFRKVVKFLVLNNLAAAIGAFSFSHAMGILSHRKVDVVFPLISFLYIYAMHVLNRFLDKGASAYNDPERATSLEKNKCLLILTGILATAIALGLAYGFGMVTFLSLSAFSLLGIIYSIRIVPGSMNRKYKVTKIKDIPGSRSLSEALAWVAIMGVLPLLDEEGIHWPGASVSFLVILFMAYCRSVLFDIFQEQGDLIVGTETLPIILGERKTLRLLKIILLAACLLLVLGPISHLTSPFSYLLLLSLVSLAFCLVAYERQWLNPGIKLEAMVEGNFILAGLLALIWQMF